MVGVVASADYGALTPHDVAVDRFGVHLDTEIFQRRPAKLTTVMAHNPLSPIRRLGLILQRWQWNHHWDCSTYTLSVHGRPLVITHRRDGRVTIEFDGKKVYDQVKRLRQGSWEVVEKINPDIEAQERAQAHEAKMDAVRERLENASASARG